VNAITTAVARSIAIALALALAVAPAIAVSGCPSPTEPSTPILGSLPEGEVPLDALSRRHSRLRERMGSRRYEEVLPNARVFAIEDRGVVLPLDLEVGACTTIVGIASPGIRDLRLGLYDGEGEEAARDDVPGEGGLVHVCPESQRARVAPYYLAVEAQGGVGSVALSQFRSAPGAGDGFEGLWDEILAPRVPFHDVEERLAEIRAPLRGRGLTPIEAPRIGWAPAGGAVRMPVRFATGRCYVAVARGGEGTRDVDLFLFDPAGVEIGRDLGADSEPTIEHCPSSAGLFVVEARAFEGEGALGILVLGGPASGGSDHPPEPIDVGTARGAPGESEEPGRPDVALDVLAAELAERGFAAPVFASRDAQVAPGEARTHGVVAGPGCSLIVASASHDGMDVDLYLADANGREIDADTAVGSTARVRVCRDQPTVLRVAVKAYGRDGRYALAVLRAPASIADVQGLRLEEAIAGPRMRGYEEVARWTVTLEEDVPFERAIDVEAGACLAIAAAGAEEVRDVDLFLRGVDGTLVASESGGAPLGTVSRCVEERTTLRLEVVVDTGRGAVALASMIGPLRASASSAPTTPAEERVEESFEAAAAR
jgi:hypothetical protein